MSIFPTFAIFFAIFLSLVTANESQAGGITAPQLTDDGDYSEYWEQLFLFEDGTFATSQFLITNLPLSKHHGIQVATLAGVSVRPFGQRIIIKNGRSRDGWTFDPEDAALNIFTHRLAGQHPGYLLQLKNTAAELDVLFMASHEAIPLVRKETVQSLPEITLYVPQAQSFGRWRAGPEVGGDGEAGSWTRLGYGSGYGLHVRQTKPLHEAVGHWLRLTSTEAAPGTPTPILHSFETPSGDVKSILLLLSPFHAPQRFDTVDLEEIKEGKAWRLSAKNAESAIEGTFSLSQELDRFRLKDHLSGVEQLVAGAAADIDRHQATAAYEFVLTSKAEAKDLSGTAILEAIQVGEGRKKRNRRLR